MRSNGICSTEESALFRKEDVRFSLTDPDRGPLPSAVIVAAHPDDEVIGAGGLFSRFNSLHFIHTTDGSPRNMADALAAGYGSHKAYADARRRELFDALRLAGIPGSSCFETGVADQEASMNMAVLIRKLVLILRKLKPVMIFTPAYEGGHPDHDATALAVHAASALLRSEMIIQPILIEYALYHAGAGGMRVFEFLATDGAGRTETVFLNPEERFRKAGMISCFRTQSAVLSAFPVAVERFRRSPRYNFCIPPHAGRLFYENFDWGMTGAGWRQLASEALNEFRIRSLI
jgi:N-acetylglucosamine malate deacetylase 2